MRHTMIFLALTGLTLLTGCGESKVFHGEIAGEPVTVVEPPSQDEPTVIIPEVGEPYIIPPQNETVEPVVETMPQNETVEQPDTEPSQDETVEQPSQDEIEQPSQDEIEPITDDADENVPKECKSKNKGKGKGCHDKGSK